jgi:hypothetical protein
LLAVIPDRIDSSDEIVGHEQGPFPVLLNVEGTAEIVAAAVPAFAKRIDGPAT